MRKIRVLFPYVEAGFGHIMPMRSIEDTFRKKYGDRVEVISSDFFNETGDRSLIRYERMMSSQVKMYNRFPVFGHFMTFADEMSGPAVSSFFTVRFFRKAYRKGVEHMQELSADVIFSTHWATNYYARHLKEKPMTVMYCPDAELNQLFSYPSDLTMISMPFGYKKALETKRFDTDNLKYVPFLIRNEAFEISSDKREIRKKLGLPEDNFTVILAEGGYGIGKIKEICKRLISEHIPLTVIAVCGKNEKLLEYFGSLVPTKEVTFVPLGFTERILEYQAASDIFCGKSGNILAEPTFFGNPTIITNCTSLIEKKIARHYIETVGCAFIEFSPKKTVETIMEFAADPARMLTYKKAALDYHGNFGSEAAAELLWKAIAERFPDQITRNG